MTDLKTQEIIDFAHSQFDPYIDISAELKIIINSDDGGRHLEFTVLDRETAIFLRKEVSHTYEGLRTIIRYNMQPQKE
tara:strand:+ start:644 stop:877 length:234 start_codon:yes stop_codon:yes gene_type:complete